MCQAHRAHGAERQHRAEPLRCVCPGHLSRVGVDKGRCGGVSHQPSSQLLTHYERHFLLQEVTVRNMVPMACGSDFHGFSITLKRSPFHSFIGLVLWSNWMRGKRQREKHLLGVKIRESCCFPHPFKAATWKVI